MSIVYGPVPSWRLGRSLGVDMVSTPGKTCSFDCIYCQLGRTIHPLGERRLFVRTGDLIAELEKLALPGLDYITFSGVAEPTLAVNLGEAIGAVKERLDYPVAVLTNSSLLHCEDVRRDLSLADLVVAKLDAPDEELFARINRPILGVSWEKVIAGIAEFRKELPGRLALQMMFVEANAHRAAEMAELAFKLSPDEVQLNTPLRPCAEKPLSPATMAGIAKHFRGLNGLNVYEAKRPEVVALSSEETQRRRPAS